jgi:hypothetical protein
MSGTTIRCGDGTVEVHAEQSDRQDRNGQTHTVYVPDCCSAQFPSLKILAASHMAGCPRDREIERLLADPGDGQ